MAIDYYAVLGVAPTATQQELRTAYLGLARSNHPDLFNGPKQKSAEVKMQAINEAWSVLGVAHERTAYDRQREAAGHSAAPGAAQSAGSKRGRSHFAAFDDEKLDAADVDLDPTPLHSSAPLPDWMRMAPILLVIFAVVVFALGVLINASAIIAVGAMIFGLGAVGFLAVPLIVMSRAAKDSPK